MGPPLATGVVEKWVIWAPLGTIFRRQEGDIERNEKLVNRLRAVAMLENVFEVPSASGD